MRKSYSAAALLIASIAATAQQPQYKLLAGSTHAHTAFTWSHGEMLEKSPCKGVDIYGLTPGSEVLFDWKHVRKPNAPCVAMLIVNGWQYHAPEMKLRPDWQQVQGAPSQHFTLAKKLGFDFYVTTDHSQESAFWPETPDNPQWLASKREAAAATDSQFVALAGFEFSENDGPGGTGHLTVINTDATLNALEPGVNMASFYRWLAKAKPNGDGPIVAGFNHPNEHSYADFTGRTPEATEIISMLEVINSNAHIHYEAFLKALDQGWKVAPTSGLDNHGLGNLPKLKSPAFVLAATKTKVGVLDAMRHRRMYASLDNNLQASYTVNRAIMGSTLNRPGEFRFEIQVTDPDTNDPHARITKMDIVKDGGEVVQSWTPPSASTTARWTPVIRDPKAHYFFVRIWSAGGGDLPAPDATRPIAWLAPVWTGVPSPMEPMLTLEQVKQRGGGGDEQ